MNNNDVFRSIQLILNINDKMAVDIFKLADYVIDPAIVSGFTKEANDPVYINCTNKQILLFLDGLITQRRGKLQENQSEIKKILPPLSNNVICKKLRIAFNLQEDNLKELLSLADFDVSKNELSAISRRLGHKHYRECSDDFLMAFLVGLTFKQWS